MSRGTAKERSRVRTGGRANTFRVVENFGSWKHNFFSQHDDRKITPLSRRFIGGENRGNKLSVSVELIEVRKPTERMQAEAEAWWGSGIKLETIRKRSNYPNRKKFRRMAKELAAEEVTTYLEDQLEGLELERRQQIEQYLLNQEDEGYAPDQAELEIQCHFAEQERTAELAELERSHIRVITRKQEEWGYHHYF